MNSAQLYMGHWSNANLSQILSAARLREVDEAPAAAFRDLAPVHIVGSSSREAGLPEVTVPTLPCCTLSGLQGWDSYSRKLLRLSRSRMSSSLSAWISWAERPLAQTTLCRALAACSFRL